MCIAYYAESSTTIALRVEHSNSKSTMPSSFVWSMDVPDQDVRNNIIRSLVFLNTYRMCSLQAIAYTSNLQPQNATTASWRLVATMYRLDLQAMVCKLHIRWRTICRAVGVVYFFKQKVYTIMYQTSANCCQTRQKRNCNNFTPQPQYPTQFHGASSSIELVQIEHAK